MALATTRKGSITLYRKPDHHKAAATTMPISMLRVKPTSVAESVVMMCLPRLPWFHSSMNVGHSALG
ncbi:hypothetical protein D9M68_699080 [compost metagenome]